MNRGFIAIDMQTAWTRPSPLTTAAIEKAAGKARKEGQPVIWAWMNFLPANTKPVRYGELKLTKAFSEAHIIDPRNGILYYPSVTPHDNDWVIAKNTRSIFGNTANGDFLKNHLRLDTLSIAGFRTNQCIAASCTDRAAGDYTIYLDPGLTADFKDRWETNIDLVFQDTGVELRAA